MLEKGVSKFDDLTFMISHPREQSPSEYYIFRRRTDDQARGEDSPGYRNPASKRNRAQEQPVRITSELEQW
jgi:hypothetical protein